MSNEFQKKTKKLKLVKEVEINNTKFCEAIDFRDDSKSVPTCPYLECKTSEVTPSDGLGYGGGTLEFYICRLFNTSLRKHGSLILKCEECLKQTYNGDYKPHKLTFKKFCDYYYPADMSLEDIANGRKVIHCVLGYYPEKDYYGCEHIDCKKCLAYINNKPLLMQIINDMKREMSIEEDIDNYIAERIAYYKALGKPCDYKGFKIKQLSVSYKIDRDIDIKYNDHIKEKLIQQLTEKLANEIIKHSIVKINKEIDKYNIIYTGNLIIMIKEKQQCE